MDVERRREPRYPIRHYELEVIVRDTGLRGAVRDMSAGGLAFEYIPEPDRSEAANMIDILCRENPEYCLHGIPCRPVYDIAVLTEDRSFRGVALRRRGLAYHGLAETHIRNMPRLFEGGAEGPV